MKLFFKLFMMFSTLWSASCVYAATYYVDFVGGSDVNAGTAIAVPWKKAPGMAGFTGVYTHQAGDRFIFKGGVTWDKTIAPWTISNSGTVDNNDYYGVDKTWFDGTTWSRPVLDGGSQNPIASNLMLGYWIISGAYITLDNITLQNIGVPGINQGNYALKLADHSHDILIENMKLAVQSRIAIQFGVRNANETMSNYEFKNNDISECSWGIGGGPGPLTVVTNVLIHDNAFHDFHNQMANGAHGDGIYFFPPGDLVAYMDGVRIYNNYFYGDFSKADTSATGMSAFIWAGAQTQGSAYVYNNVMTYTRNGGGIGGAIAGGGALPNGTIYVLNNSYFADKNSIYFVTGQYVGTLVVKNNIAIGASAYEGLQPPLSHLVTDYNAFYNWNSFAFNLSYTGFKTSGPIASIAVKTPGSGYTVGSVISPKYGIGALATVTSVDGAGGVTGLELTAGGYGFYPNYPGIVSLVSGSGSGLTVNFTVPVSSGFETKGISVNPLFVSNSDLQLQSGSPAIGTGINLSTLCALNQAGLALCMDYNGNARPANGNWDIGAYQFQANLPGDVSNDGMVTMYDAALVLKYTVGGALTTAQQAQADINSDTVIDAADAMMIAKKALGMN